MYCKFLYVLYFIIVSINFRQKVKKMPFRQYVNSSYEDYDFLVEYKIVTRDVTIQSFSAMDLIDCLFGFKYS